MIPFVDAVTHVSELSDLAINALVDLHIFGEVSPYCPGRLEYHYISAGGVGTPYWQCDRCGAITSKSVQHRRAIPAYSSDIAMAWRIIEKLKKLDAKTLFRFECMLQQYYHCRILALTGRMIGIAALQATGVVDDSGYVIPNDEVTQ